MGQAATPQTDALVGELPADVEVPAAARRALDGARQLEQEVMHLRHSLHEGAPGGPAQREQVMQLLSKVLLFRVALRDDAEREQFKQVYRG